MASNSGGVVTCCNIGPYMFGIQFDLLLKQASAWHSVSFNGDFLLKPLLSSNICAKYVQHTTHMGRCALVTVTLPERGAA